MLRRCLRRRQLAPLLRRQLQKSVERHAAADASSSFSPAMLRFRAMRCWHAADADAPRRHTHRIHMAARFTPC